MEWLTAALQTVAAHPSALGDLLLAAGAGSVAESRLRVVGRILPVVARAILSVSSSNSQVPVPPSPRRSASARRTPRKVRSSEPPAPANDNEQKLPF